MTEQPSIIGQEISGCEILNKVAEGGMGAVYKARHKALNRIVCVKILSPALANDKKAVELFLTEARAIAELDHPNIVNVYNVGRQKGYYFIVMSFIEGVTLSTLIKQKKVLPVGTVLDLFDGVLQGLAAAHEKGIIHRDIKPSNILINPQGQAKLVDFGIAKKMDKEKGSTKSTELAGTAYFIAPEQALGRDLDTRADLYSIGASMYYVLTGRFPYSGKNTMDIIQKHINEPVPDPLKLRKDLPAWLALSIQKLMSKNPDNRFSTAKEVYMYFRKMRAEDQLRIKTNNTGRAIDLTEEGSLKIIDDENLNTETMRRLRTANKERGSLSSITPVTQPIQTNSLLPKIDTSGNVPPPQPRAATKSPSIEMLKEEDVKPVNVFVPPVQQEKKGFSASKLFSSNPIRLLKKLAWALPLFIVVTCTVSTLFHKLGIIDSVYADTNASLFANLIAPYMTNSYAPGQVLYTAICLGVVVGLFALTKFKIFSNSLFSLLLLAFASYVAGMFTPEISLTDLSGMFHYLFSPEYYFCYFIFALAGSLLWCWKLNRSWGEGLFAAALVAATLLLAHLCSHLTVAPSSAMSFKIILFLALLFGLGAFYFIISSKHKDSMVLPTLFLLLAVAGLWIYGVSGVAESLDKTVQTLIARTDVTQHAQVDKALKTEANLGLDTKRNFFAAFDQTNELTNLTNEEARKVLLSQVKKLTDVFDPVTESQLLDILIRHYREGAASKWIGIWNYAMHTPFRLFNQTAPASHAYSFLVMLLFWLALATHVGTLVFGEDYEQL